jgi:hypothetical protein
MTGNTRNYVDWDDEWAGLKARVEALEEQIESMVCATCGDKNPAPESAGESGKRMLLHMFNYGDKKDEWDYAYCRAEPGDCQKLHIPVVPAAEADAAKARAKGLREALELWVRASLDLADYAAEKP